MSGSRDEILKRLRRGPRRRPARGVDERLAAHPRGPQPAWSQSNVDRFIAGARAASAELATTGSPAACVELIVGYLERHALAPRLVATDAPLLKALPWPPAMHIEHRAARGDDDCALTLAYAGVAETGSLVMLSGATSPVGLNFLPDHYISVLPRDRIVAHIDDLWERLRRDRAPLPRSVNFITGPSRTADVEQTIQLGAHGPRRVYIVILG